MDYWQRVDIESPAQSQTATGNVREIFSVLLEDVEARVLPRIVDEKLETWATPEEDAHEIQLRGSWLAIRPRMRVVHEGAVYDIRRIIQPPPFGEPSTILQTVRVTP